MGVARDDREISAQSCPVSGMDRAASRTTPDTIFSGFPASVFYLLGKRLAGKNRARHRRWRGRFAVLDPARSMPGAPSCLLRSGGNHVSRTTYRRTARRASEHQRQGRTPADRGRTENGTGGTGPALAGGRLTGQNQGGSGAASVALLPSCCSRMAVFKDSGWFQADRTQSARLKVDLVSEINLLSAHHYFTRQAYDPARQGHSKLLIVLGHPRDSLIYGQASDQPRQSFLDLQGDEARP